MNINFKIDVNLIITEKGKEIFNESNKTIEEFKEYVKEQLNELILNEIVDDEQEFMTVEVNIESD